MKKIVLVIMSITLVLSLASCSSLEIKDESVLNSEIAVLESEIVENVNNEILEFELFVSPMYQDNAEEFLDELLKSYDVVEHTYSEGRAVIKATQTQANVVLEDMKVIAEETFEFYKENGVLNSVEIDNTGTMLVIDYGSEAQRPDMSIVLGQFVDYLTITQAFSGIPVDDFGISVTILINSEEFSHFVLNEEYYAE